MKGGYCHDENAVQHRAPIRSGALTLLLALAAICLAVLAVLSLATAQADLSLAQNPRPLPQDAALENEGQPGLLVSIIMSLVGGLLVPCRLTWLFLRRDWDSLN